MGQSLFIKACVSRLVQVNRTGRQSSVLQTLIFYSHLVFYWILQNLCQYAKNMLSRLASWKIDSNRYECTINNSDVKCSINFARKQHLKRRWHKHTKCKTKFLHAAYSNPRDSKIKLSISQMPYTYSERKYIAWHTEKYVNYASNVSISNLDCAIYARYAVSYIA